MKRSAALQTLSREHHNALVLAQRIAVAAAAAEEDAVLLLMAAVPAVFECEIDPHFRVEEETLLPRMEAAGQINLVRHTEKDHRLLRALAQRISAGDRSALEPFGLALKEHVRFEERELFAAAERVLAAEPLPTDPPHFPTPSDR